MNEQDRPHVPEYLKALGAHMDAVGKELGGGLHQVEIRHDDDCPAMRGDHAGCNCDAVIESGKRVEDMYRAPGIRLIPTLEGRQPLAIVADPHGGIDGFATDPEKTVLPLFVLAMEGLGCEITVLGRRYRVDGVTRHGYLGLERIREEGDER